MELKEPYLKQYLSSVRIWKGIYPPLYHTNKTYREVLRQFVCEYRSCEFVCLVWSSLGSSRDSPFQTLQNIYFRRRNSSTLNSPLPAFDIFGRSRWDRQILLYSHGYFPHGSRISRYPCCGIDFPIPPGGSSPWVIVGPLSAQGTSTDSQGGLCNWLGIIRTYGCEKGKVEGDIYS